MFLLSLCKQTLSCLNLPMADHKLNVLDKTLSRSLLNSAIMFVLWECMHLFWYTEVLVWVMHYKEEVFWNDQFHKPELLHIYEGFAKHFIQVTFDTNLRNNVLLVFILKKRYIWKQIKLSSLNNTALNWTGPDCNHERKHWHALPT